MLTGSNRSGRPRAVDAVDSPKRGEYSGYHRRLSRQGTMTVLLLRMVVWGCARGSFFDGDDEAARAAPTGLLPILMFIRGSKRRCSPRSP